MPQVKSDVDQVNTANWEGAAAAMLVAYIMAHGQLVQYLMVNGVPREAIMAGLTLGIQRLWVYVRAGRQIAAAKMDARVAQMLEDAKTKAGAPKSSYP